MDSINGAPPPPSKSNKGSIGVIVGICGALVLAFGVYYFFVYNKDKHNPDGDTLSYVSECNTSASIGGWPDHTRAQYIGPSGTVTDSASCGKACVAASADVEAALYVSPTNECQCFKNWSSISACYTDAWPNDGKTRVPTLLTSSGESYCTLDKPLQKCGQGPNPWQAIPGAIRGIFTPSLSSRQSTDDACSRWCQSQPGAQYFNFDQTENACYCGTNAETDNPNINPLTQCVVHRENWTTGPGVPATECPTRLTYLSNCHTSASLKGWPDKNLASGAAPSGEVSDSMSCASLCEKTFSDVDAAVYLRQPKTCMCYRRWKDDGVCYDPSNLFLPTSQIDLWATSIDTGCSTSTPPGACSQVGSCQSLCALNQGGGAMICQYDEANNRCRPPAKESGVDSRPCSQTSDCPSCHCT